MNMELFKDIKELNNWRKTNNELKNEIMKGRETDINLAITIETEIYNTLSKFKNMEGK